MLETRAEEPQPQPELEPEPELEQEPEPEPQPELQPEPEREEKVKRKRQRNRVKVCHIFPIFYRESQDILGDLIFQENVPVVDMDATHLVADTEIVESQDILGELMGIKNESAPEQPTEPTTSNDKTTQTEHFHLDYIKHGKTEQQR